MQLTAKEHEICEKLLVLGRTDGNEHAYYSFGGEEYWVTSGEKYQVRPEEWLNTLLTKQKEHSVVTWHYHPYDSPPSSQDLSHLLYNQLLSEGIIGENGNVYKESIGEGILPSPEDFDKTVNEIVFEFTKNNLYKLSLDEWTIDNYNYYLSREIAYRVTNTYEWLYEGGKL